MIDHLFVPLDESETSESVLPHVRRLIRSGASRVTLFEADPPVAVGASMGVIQPFRSSSADYLGKVKRALESEKAECQVVTEVGSPASLIVRTARDLEVSLIVMATHGRTGLAEVMFGGVTRRVLRQSPIPVLVCPPPWSYELAPPEPPEARPFRNILVPFDGGPGSVDLLPVLSDFLRLTHAGVVLLHVLDPEAQGRSGGEALLGGKGEAPVRPPGLEEAERELDRAAGGLLGEGFKVRRFLDQGDVVETILAASQSLEIDAIAMATSARLDLAHWLWGSTPERILRASNVPLFLLNARAARKWNRARPRARSTAG